MAHIVDAEVSTHAATMAATDAAPPAIGAFRLPPKLLRDAAYRLALVSIYMAGLIVLVQFFQQFAQPRLASVLSDPINRLVSLASVLTGVGIFLLERYKLVTPSTLLALGLFFEILVAFAIAMVETSWPLNPDQPVLGLSSMGPWIVAVGAIIPNRPIWTLVTALAAATMWPLAYAINHARFHFPAVPWGAVAAWPTINYLLAILAFYIGRRIYGTTIAAQEAADLGSYRLVSPIGRGGMGEVWRATHQMLARAAAIKLIKAEAFSGPSARQANTSLKRFRREANVIASLQSPHTVYLYDFGTSKDGRWYYVMELLDGISLQELVDNFGPVPAPRVVAILRQTCESLEEAHQQGLVHRDLKPSNIMVCKLALQHDFVKVLDFGLAKFVGPVNTTQLTMEGVTTGTPAYMAPEIAMGQADVDVRADIYALGCVAYFLLTGTLVFQDENPMSVALKHVQERPDPPSLRTELPIPPAVERIVMQCLEKMPSARPASAAEVSALLAASGVPDWTADDATAWWDHHLPPTSTLRASAQPATHTPPVVQKI
ncbi:MAG: serine/threonine-protein kinase [Acidobacteriota bacterium]